MQASQNDLPKNESESFLRLLNFGENQIYRVTLLTSFLFVIESNYISLLRKSKFVIYHHDGHVANDQGCVECCDMLPQRIYHSSLSP